MSIPGKVVFALLCSLLVSAAGTFVLPQADLLSLLVPSAISAVLAVVLSHRALPVPEAIAEAPSQVAKSNNDRAASSTRGASKSSGSQGKRDKDPKQRSRADGPKRDNGGKAPAPAALEDGTVKWFNVTKGYGFIVRANGEEIFVHHRSVRGEGRGRLDDGAPVRFRVVDTDKGPQAEDVEAV
jgi:cold shock CspA family protein